MRLSGFHVTGHVYAQINTWKEERKCILRVAINPFIVILTILAITVILNLGLSIPSPETLTCFYDIRFQPTTAINYSKLCATKKAFALI
ncbi:Alpha-glucosides permease MPH3 [Fusarium oxysporum f. sp. albedinis]|nr:Alpha-glucosides permease MPH3 [Fusarium oxysporum f. sp. albedinis]